MRLNLKTPAERQHYRQVTIGTGSTRDPRSTDKAEVYTYEKRDSTYFYARAYIGTSAHPVWHYSFRTEAARETHIANFFESRKASEEFKAAQKTARDSFRHTLQVGDIVHTSWGYDQTNVSFFEVTRVVSEKSVAVREIKATTVETGFMCGQTTPMRGEFCGDEHVRRVRNGNIVVNCEHGRYDGYPCGTEAQRCSWYA